MRSGLGFLHFHIRKRVHQKKEKYPNPDKLKRSVDEIVYVIAFLGPIMTIPQVMKIWLGQNAEGISLISWISFTIFSFFWLFYGIIHKEKPIITANALTLMLNIIIVFGAFKFNANFF
ncbi:MAG: SemiSWEET family transporter [Candidatus Pacearchaeota archaeon]|jgi:MtN3 and saliva related transmembrane protein